MYGCFNTSLGVPGPVVSRSKLVAQSKTSAPDQHCTTCLVWWVLPLVLPFVLPMRLLSALLRVSLMVLLWPLARLWPLLTVSFLLAWA